jgi:3-dehydroquinate synthase
MADAVFFGWLEEHMAALLARECEVLAIAIERCCQLKAQIVAADERESGARALLNLGHTFGHAIEAAQDYRGLLHGEAVAAGMAMAARCSADMGWLSETEYHRTIALLTAAGLPTGRPVELDAARLRDLMASDKKVSQGKIRLVLLNGIGAARLTAEYPESTLRAVLERAAS